MAFPENIFVPIGVITAALIAGGIAYAGLVSTKESKISEFRQNWISELREEISQFIGCIESLIEHLLKENKGMFINNQSFMQKKLNHSELYTDMLKARTSILLRINNKEKEKEDFERNDSFIKLILRVSENFENGKIKEVTEDILALTDIARLILKHEWNRARDGEQRFQAAKASAQWLIGTAGAFLMATLMCIAFEEFQAMYAHTSNTQITQTMQPTISLL